jgi:undecaprenyl diphosphate synthase
VTALSGLHVAVIMDGNGRWAEARHLPRTAGHEAGAETLGRVVEAAPDLGVSILTAYAFSSDNWRRPVAEVRALLGLFASYLHRATDRLHHEDVRLTVIGRRDRVPRSLARAIAAAEATTVGGRRLHLRLAVDYSSRDAITLAAAAAGAAGGVDRASIDRRVGSGRGRVGPGPAVDLLIRTGGEQRLSDFLLWEAAYAELWFTETAWPDFTTAELGLAIAEFRGRDRRFGGASARPVPACQSPV